MTIDEVIKTLEYTKRNCGMPVQGDVWKPNKETIALETAIRILKEAQNGKTLTSEETSEWEKYLVAKKELEEKSNKSIDVAKLLHYFLETVFEGEKHERFCILTNEDALRWDAYQAFGTVEEIDAKLKDATKTLEQSKIVIETAMNELEKKKNIIRTMLNKAFDEAIEEQVDELDIYTELLENGITVETVRDIMGDEAASHMEKFCKEHGLIQESRGKKNE